VPVEFINIRVAVRAPVSGSDVVLEGRPGQGARAALKGTRRAYFPGADGWVETAVYDRYRLGIGDRLSGPAVVEEEGSTLVIGPDATAEVAPSGNIVVTLAPQGEGAG
jgi:N-methylhydantoinase A